MNTLRIMRGLPLILILTASSPAFALQTAQDQGMVVGHLTHVEGNLLRYVTDDGDWVQLVKDSPVGMEDLLFCEEDAKAEIIIPNNTWIRTGGNTKVQITNLAHDATELDIDSGIARFYNKSSASTITVNTPFGRVRAPSLTTFDVYLQADSVQVQAREGTVTFLYLRDNAQYEVTAGGTSLLADYEQITSGGGLIDEAWNDWNLAMDERWEDRLRDAGDEQNYLPETIRHESYTLHDNGIWETVYYEGRNCSFWRPLYVPSYWSPYTVGRWTVWYGDQCWIPCEPFGYVTHHYGNWVYIDSCNRWYWAPPDCHRRHEDIFFLVLPFAWNPGRVSWIHRGDYVGWIPLAPFETYYGYRSWGPLSRVVAKDPRRHHTDFDIKACRYKHHAVVVKKSSLYGVTNYIHNRIRNRADTFISNFRREAGINSRVINNFKTIKQRFTFDNHNAKKLPRPVAFKPAVRMKPADNLLAKKNPALRKIAALPEGGKTFKQSVRKPPVNTVNKKQFSDIQTIRGTTVSTFKPIQRYKPHTTGLEARTKIPVPPERRQQIGIPGGEKRQMLPQLNRQRPAAGSGVALQKREAPRTLNLQVHERTPRLKAVRPAGYTNNGRVNRPSLVPGSAGFGRK